MAFTSEVLKIIIPVDDKKAQTQRALTIMKYGASVQLVKQEYWWDENARKLKPGKLKGLSIEDLQRLDDIGLDKVIKFMKKREK